MKAEDAKAQSFFDTNFTDYHEFKLAENPKGI